VVYEYIIETKVAVLFLSAILGGSIGAILANVCGASVTVQVIVFVAVSVLTLVIARPYLRRFTRTKVQPTNLDMCVGQPALVTETIDNLAETGQAKIRGNLWTARSADGSVIEQGKTVTVVRIEGVKLIVAPAKE